MKSHTFWKHPTSYYYQFLPCPWTRLSEVNETSQWTFLTSWPWRLAYELDLLIWPRYPSTWPGKIQVCILYVCQFDRDCERNRQTDRHTDRQCQNYYTNYLRDAGCKYTMYHEGLQTNLFMGASAPSKWTYLKESFLDRVYEKKWSYVILCHLQ